MQPSVDKQDTTSVTSNYAFDNVNDFAKGRYRELAALYDVQTIRQHNAFLCGVLQLGLTADVRRGSRRADRMLGRRVWVSCNAGRTFRSITVMNPPKSTASMVSCLATPTVLTIPNTSSRGARSLARAQV